MKTAISLPDDLFGAAERTARRLGLTRSELFRRALTSFLQQHDDRLVTQVLDAVYEEGIDGSELEPVLREIQSLSLPADEW